MAFPVITQCVNARNVWDTAVSLWWVHKTVCCEHVWCLLDSWHWQHLVKINKSCSCTYSTKILPFSNLWLIRITFVFHVSVLSSASGPTDTSEHTRTYTHTHNKLIGVSIYLYSTCSKFKGTSSVCNTIVLSVTVWTVCAQTCELYVHDIHTVLYTIWYY